MVVDHFDPLAPTRALLGPRPRGRRQERWPVPELRVVAVDGDPHADMHDPDVIRLVVRSPSAAAHGHFAEAGTGMPDN
jgi:hypothetical protein